MKSIRGRLLVILLVGLTIVLVLGGAAVYVIEKTSLMRQFNAALESRARTVAALVKLEPGGEVFELGDAPKIPMQQTFFEFRTADGELLRRSPNLGDVALPMRTLAEGEVAFGDTPLPAGTPGRAAWLALRPRVDPDDWEGLDISRANPQLLVLAVALDRGPIDRALTSLLTALLVVGAVVGLTMAALVSVGVGWGLSPLRRLVQQLGRVEGTTISNRFDARDTPNELMPIYRELNRMLDRVEQTLERERTFADAAAHELRTPLSELRAAAEVALRWPDAQQTTKTLHEVHAIGSEMERLVESLLLISRGRAKAGSDETGKTPIATIVHRWIQRMNGTITDKDIELHVKLDGREILPGSRECVEIILRNLIDNAIRYTPPQGRITITNGLQTNGSPTIIVENGPVSLNDDEVARLFDPFWQQEASRSDRQHVGLGLTVVQRLASSAGLSVRAVLNEDRLQMRIAFRE